MCSLHMDQFGLSQHCGLSAVRLLTWRLVHEHWGSESQSQSHIVFYYQASEAMQSLLPHFIGYEQITVPLRIKERGIGLYPFLRKWQSSRTACVIVIVCLENTVTDK